MTYLILLLVLAALLSVETIRLMITDGGGSMTPPRSHFTDPRFRSPLARR